MNTSNTNSFVADTLSNLAKRQARREYFKKSLVICSMIFAVSLIIGGLLYLRFSSHTDQILTDTDKIPLPFSYGIRDSLRRQLKLFAILSLPIILQFASGFTLFSQYICVPVTAGSGILCGGVALAFTSEIFTATASPRFIAYYTVYILCGAVYCAACVCMSCVSMSFSASLRHNSKTNSKLNENDTAEYFNFFTTVCTAVLMLVIFHCIGLYTIALFK